jgi:UDP-N-acetylglucosamine--N-acetylmuramyl-(pentapeptide) pyrophosphoryl-undecaprenol N-acetylglucosamine transferase
MSTFLIAAGGTGGHLFPAESLAAELGRRGHTVDLVTDERADKYGRAFPARAIHIVPSATVAGRSPVAMARTAFALGRGFLASSRLIRRLKPAAVVGFGGYPTFPPLRAAQFLAVPTVIHEANAVMGRANRMLAPKATRIAVAFPNTGLMDGHDGKAIVVGNPVRDMVIAAADTPYDPPAAGGALRLGRRICRRSRRPMPGWGSPPTSRRSSSTCRRGSRRRTWFSAARAPRRCRNSR